MWAQEQCVCGFSVGNKRERESTAGISLDTVENEYRNCFKY